MPGGTRFQSSFAGNAKLIPEVPWPVTRHPKRWWFSKGVLTSWGIIVQRNWYQVMLCPQKWMAQFECFITCFFEFRNKYMNKFPLTTTKIKQLQYAYVWFAQYFFPGTIYGTYIIYIYTTSNCIYILWHDICICIFIYIHIQHISMTYTRAFHITSVTLSSPGLVSLAVLAWGADR